jgi:hypothetical protein
VKKSRAVSVPLVASVAALAVASGCGSSNPTHQRLCGDAKGIAVEVEKCEQEVRQTQPHGHGYMPLYHYYYAPVGRSYPVGSPLSGASLTAPSGPGVRVAAPSHGSPSSHTVRGGFGSSAHSSSAS